MKKLSNLALIALALYGVSRFCTKQTDGFSLPGIASHRPFNPEWECHPLSSAEQEEVDKALHQKYTYFGCGGQSFVFFSEDGNYVIKFFKQRIFAPPSWINRLPIPYLLDKYKAKKTWKRADKLNRDFSSYRLSFDALQEETGVIFVHLNKTTHLNTQLEIVDRLNITHHLDLDQTDFVVQRKAELIYDRVTAQMAEGDVAGAKTSVRKALQFIANRCRKGYHDRDPNLRTNCGFIGEAAVKIDVGRFLKLPVMQDPKVILSETQRIGAPFKQWLQENYPALIPTYEEEIGCLKPTVS